MMKSRVKFGKEVPGLKVAGYELGPFGSGDEADLPYWAARVFLRRGDGTGQAISAAEVRRKIVLEESRSELGELQPDFFSLARENVLALRAAGKHEEAENLKSMVLKLVEVRVLKLLKLAVDPENANVEVPEEKFLLNLMGKVLDFWTRDLLEFLELGEEVRGG